MFHTERLNKLWDETRMRKGVVIEVANFSSAVTLSIFWKIVMARMPLTQRGMRLSLAWRGAGPPYEHATGTVPRGYYQKTDTDAKNSVLRDLPFPAKTNLVVQASSYHIISMILKVWCRKAPGMHCNCQCASVLQMENTLCQTLQFACVKLLVGLSLWFLDSKHLGPHIQTPTLLHSICNGVDGSCYNLILEQVKISCNSVSKTCITTN